MKKAFFVSLILLAIFSCEDSPEQQNCDSDVSFNLGEEFSLCYGGTIQWDENPNVTVTFDDILNKRECGFDQDCIWTRWISVQLRIAQNGEEETTDISFGTPQYGYQMEKTVGNFNVKFVGVEPEDFLTSTAPPEDYKVKLIITQ